MIEYLNCVYNVLIFLKMHFSLKRNIVFICGSTHAKQMCYPLRHHSSFLFKTKLYNILYKLKFSTNNCYRVNLSTYTCMITTKSWVIIHCSWLCPNRIANHLKYPHHSTLEVHLEWSTYILHWNVQWKYSSIFWTKIWIVSKLITLAL